ncbi:MAG: hypothetical protein HIU84_08860 [Acidobacteria bacterium]|nr:hypothetical protein [Acidobacteriota bacterium]
MIEGKTPIDSPSYDPGSMPASSLLSQKAVLYRRPWFLITVAVIVVVAVSVIVDLPHPITKVEDATAQNASMKQINTDIGPCVFAVKEAFSFYEQKVSGRLSTSNLAQVPSLLVGDQTACSFTSGSIYDLTNNIQVLDTKAGKNIDHMLSVVVLWSTSDALAAIEDIQYLFSHPGDSKKLQNLAKEEALLTTDRTLALNYVAQAERTLGLKLKQPIMPVLPQLSGT